MASTSHHHHHQPGAHLHPKQPNPGSSSTNPANTFTPEMRDRQARGSEYTSDEDSDMEAYRSSRYKLGGAPSKNDTYAAREKRQQAYDYLDNPELLMMYAQAKGDSIPAARLHFMKVMCGFDGDEMSGGNDKGRQRGGAGGGGGGDARMRTRFQSGTGGSSSSGGKGGGA